MMMENCRRPGGAVNSPVNRRPKSWRGLVRDKCELQMVDDAVADLAVLFIEGEAFQREHRPNHVFPHPLGIDPSLGPDPAVNIEPRVPPG